MQCMKTRIFALAVVLATFASNASAATINIFYTGVITTRNKWAHRSFNPVIHLLSVTSLTPPSQHRATT